MPLFVPPTAGRIEGTDYRIVGPWSPEFGMSAALRSIQPTATNWTNANDPLALPFYLNQAATVTKLGWFNGSSVGTNWDQGIYTASWARLVSTGSTARSGTSVWQWVDTTDVALAPGTLYYLVGVNSATSGQNVRAWTTALSINQFLGCLDSTTNALPLPDPLTDMGVPSSLTVIPAMAMALGSYPI